MDSIRHRNLHLLHGRVGISIAQIVRRGNDLVEMILKYKRSPDYYFSFLTQDTVTTTLETTFDVFSERTIGLPHAIYELASDRSTSVASDVLLVQNVPEVHSI